MASLDRRRADEQEEYLDTVLVPASREGAARRVEAQYQWPAAHAVQGLYASRLAPRCCACSVHCIV